MRSLGFAAALAASWIVLLLWAAGIEWSAPVEPVERLSWNGSEFTAVFGQGRAQATQLHMEAASDDDSSLQAVALPGLDASDYRTLRYRFADFPRTLELSLVFRTAEAPGDVQTISLPWPGEGMSSFDLSHVDRWHGTIIEIGFAEFATGQVVPPELGFHPFDLVRVEMWSPSWRGDLAALATDWLGAWPWSQRSVHALGREGDAPRARSAVLVAAIAAALAIAWAALLLRLRGRALQVSVVAWVVVAWLALDMRWQSGLMQRLWQTRALYAGLSWPERARIVGDSDILLAADELREILRGEPPQTRILIQSDSSYAWQRLAWHLLPLNVGGLSVAAPFDSGLPEGSLVVFYDSDAWRSNPDLRELLADSQRVTSVASVFNGSFEGSPLVVFRFHHAQ